VNLDFLRGRKESATDEDHRVDDIPEDAIFSVRGLQKYFDSGSGFLGESTPVRAVDGVSFDVREGETLGIVGESGCGKSTLAQTMIRLQEPTAGSVYWKGDQDVTGFDDARLKRWRREIQMMFQDPSSSFDPRMSIGDSITEPLRVQGLRESAHRREIAEDLLERVGMSAGHIDAYPHEFSGGQKQRIALARALAVNPDMIVADEPVSALDVSIQSEVLGLIDRLQEEFGLTMCIISHDLGVIREVCDRVAVMYLGEIVEIGPTEEVFTSTAHPYTKALVSSIPVPDPTQRGDGIELHGDVPDPSNPPTGCRFHTRCPAVVQPSELDLDQQTYVRLLQFSKRLSRGIVTEESVEGVRELLAEQQGVDPDDVPREDLVEELREEDDLPEQTGSARVDSALRDALGALADGDVAAAADELSLLATPCASEAPEAVDVGETDDHTASCLRLTSDYEPVEAVGLE
jgi:peptide/nickel transport system ATP-binding protein